MKGRQWQRLRAALLIGAISLVITVPVAELLLRRLCWYCTWSEANAGGKATTPYEVREDTWYMLRPANAVLQYAQSEFDFEIRTNSQGFRDVDHPIGKAPDELRVLAVGDSFTEGQGAAFEETWLNVLGRTWNQGRSAGRVTMINAGVAGSDPFYGYRVLADHLLPHDPDLVLLVVNNSDVLDVVARGGMERFLPDGRVAGLEPPAIAPLYLNSHFARFVLFELLDYTHYLITRTERSRRAAEAIVALDGLVERFASLSAEHGARFALVLFPLRGEMRDGHYDFLEALAVSARKRGVKVVDAMPYLQQKRRSRGLELAELYWVDDGHYRPLGYRYVAEAVNESLCADVPSKPWCGGRAEAGGS